MEARKRARQALKDGKDPKAALAKANVDSKVVKSKGATKQAMEPQVKKKKERAPLEYKGTMRGTGSMPPRPVNTKPDVSSAKKKTTAGYSSASGSEMDAPELGKRYRYADYDDEEDEEEDDYESEGSEDMEGGGFDELEAEEEASLRAARKEDLQALREEEAHRKEKLDRKNKLKALASKAKPQRY